MDIRETKQRFKLEHNYCCNQIRVNEVEVISDSLLCIYISTEVDGEIIMNLNIKDGNSNTIAKFRNIEVNKINDFDEGLSDNIILIKKEIEIIEDYYNKKQKK